MQFLVGLDRRGERGGVGAGIGGAPLLQFRVEGGIVGEKADLADLLAVERLRGEASARIVDARERIRVDVVARRARLFVCQ